VIRVFPAVDPENTRTRAAFLGAAGEGLETFLRELRTLVVAVPNSRFPGDAEGERAVLHALQECGIPHVATPSHSLLSISSIGQLDAAAAASTVSKTILAPIVESVRRYSRSEFHVPVPEGYLTVGHHPLIMGILNVTPDSFSDGDAYRTVEEAIGRGVLMEEEGAAILDVGGESTRPGSLPVPAEEELRRVIPVIRGLARKVKATISIDTTKAAVAREAADAGARIVNDTSALSDDPGMAEAVRETGCAAVLMHRRGAPETMQREPRYDSLFDELLAELSERVGAAVAAGIDPEKILVDPGIGFGKRLEDNLALHRYLGELRVLGRPIVFGPSRKRFIGALTGMPAAQRQFGTAAAVSAAVLAGAHVVRVHDVKEMRDAVRVAAAIREAAEC
jgi:dihydropteroate synthase